MSTKSLDASAPDRRRDTLLQLSDLSLGVSPATCPPREPRLGAGPKSEAGPRSRHSTFPSSQLGVASELPSPLVPKAEQGANRRSMPAATSHAPSQMYPQKSAAAHALAASLSCPQPPPQIAPPPQPRGRRLSWVDQVKPDEDDHDDVQDRCKDRPLDRRPSIEDIMETSNRSKERRRSSGILRLRDSDTAVDSQSTRREDTSAQDSIDDDDSFGVPLSSLPRKSRTDSLELIRRSTSRSIFEARRSLKRLDCRATGLVWPTYKPSDRHTMALDPSLVEQEIEAFLKGNREVKVMDKISVFVNQKIAKYTSKRTVSPSIISKVQGQTSGFAQGLRVIDPARVSGFRVKLKQGSPARVTSRPEGCEVQIYSPHDLPMMQVVKLQVNETVSLPVLFYFMEDIDASSPLDESPAFLVDILALENGRRLVAADCYNSCLKVLDQKGSRWTVSRQTVPGSPVSLTALTGKLVMALMPVQHKAALVSLSPCLNLLRVLHTTRSYWGVAALDEDHVAVSYNGQPGGVEVINLLGQCVGSLSSPQDGWSSLITNPRYLSLTPNGDLLLSDWCQNKVICISDQGQLRWTWSDPRVCGPLGVCCVPGEGFRGQEGEWVVWLTDMSENVWQLSAELKHVQLVRPAIVDKKQILLKQPIRDPHGLCLSLRNHIFITQSTSGRTIMVFER